jgi:hypothetical protein
MVRESFPVFRERVLQKFKFYLAGKAHLVSVCEKRVRVYKLV